MFKFSPIFLTIALLLSGCSKQLVERWCKSEDNTLIKEIYWADYHHRLKEKEIEFRRKTLNIFLYDDSLMKTAILINNSEHKMDTFTASNFYHDNFGNLIRIETTRKGEKKSIVENELTLDKKTNKPTLIRIIINGDLNNYRKVISYDSNRIETKTFRGDSLLNYYTKYLDSAGRTTDLVRRHYIFDPPIWDSTHHVYDQNRLIREVHHFNHKYAGEDYYIYKKDRLKQIQKRDGNDTTYVDVKYSRE